MANAGPNTNGSQFFICHQDLTGKLPKNYTIFGQVTKGMDVVDAIAARRATRSDLPDEPVAMTGGRRSTRTESGLGGPRGTADAHATNVKEFTSRSASKPLAFGHRTRRMRLRC